VRIFVSSVRRGLEEERDALPGLISAIGHTPVRFEDFSAQPLPSREACVAGVASADAYLLILGPNYGHRFSDTGQSPTHDEWIAAQSAGIPRVVYRKEGVTFESEQEAFVRSIGDYTTGVFYDTFTTTAELLTKVAGKVRELHEAGDPLTFSPLTAPVTVTWRADFEPQERHGYVSTPTSLEIHVVPVSAPVRPARIMGDLASALPVQLRESGLVDASEPLNTSRPDGAIVVTVPHRQTGWNAVREPQVLGIRLSVNGQASVWATLPGDGMGSILDGTELPTQIAGLLRLIGHLRVVESPSLAIAIGIQPTMMLSTGRVDQLPRQSASMLSMSDKPIRVHPDETVSQAALDVGAPEVAQILTRLLLDTATGH
jgi:Domain of unknown function (DUF4062)